MSDYNAELRQEQDRVRLLRERAYSRAPGETLVLGEEETEWIYAAIYKLLRVKNHTRAKAKAMDDLVDAANYIGLLFHRWWLEGARPAEATELPPKEPA